MYNVTDGNWIFKSLCKVLIEYKTGLKAISHSYKLGKGGTIIVSVLERHSEETSDLETCVVKTVTWSDNLFCEKLNSDRFSLENVFGELMIFAGLYWDFLGKI